MSRMTELLRAEAALHDAAFAFDEMKGDTLEALIAAALRYRTAVIDVVGRDERAVTA